MPTTYAPGFLEDVVSMHSRGEMTAEEAEKIVLQYQKDTSTADDTADDTADPNQKDYPGIGLEKKAREIMQPVKDYAVKNSYNMPKNRLGDFAQYGAETGMNVPESAARLVEFPIKAIQAEDDYEEKYGSLGHVMQAWDMAKGIAGGTVNAVRHPIQSFHDAPIETYLAWKGAGQVAKGGLKVAGSAIKKVPPKVRSISEEMLRGSVRYKDRVSDSDVAASTKVQLDTGGSVTKEGKANIKAELGRAGSAQQEFIDAGQLAGQQAPVAGMYRAITDYVRSRSGKLSAEDRASIKIAADHVASIIDPAAIPGQRITGQASIKQIDKLKQALQQTNRKKYEVGANPSTGEAVEMAVANWAKETVEKMQPGIEVPNKAYHDLTLAMNAVSQRLRQLENSSIVPHNLARDIVSRIPASVAHYLGFGRGALSPAEFSGLLQRPDVRSRVAVKLNEWLGQRNEFNYPKPATVTPPHPGAPPPPGPRPQAPPFPGAPPPGPQQAPPPPTTGPQPGPGPQPPPGFPPPGPQQSTRQQPSPGPRPQPPPGQPPPGQAPPRPATGQNAPPSPAAPSRAKLVKEAKSKGVAGAERMSTKQLDDAIRDVEDVPVAENAPPVAVQAVPERVLAAEAPRSVTTPAEDMPKAQKPWDVAAKEISTIKSELKEKHGDSGFSVNAPHEGKYVYSPDMSSLDIGRWRRTSINAQGEPTGHYELRNHAEAIHDAAVESYSEKLRSPSESTPEPVKTVRHFEDGRVETTTVERPAAPVEAPAAVILESRTPEPPPKPASPVAKKPVKGPKKVSSPVATTPAKSAEIIRDTAKAAKDAGIDPKAQKAFLLGELDKAIKGNTDGPFVTVDVPGDGKFKIPNDPGSLSKFRKHMEDDFPSTGKIEKPTKHGTAYNITLSGYSPEKQGSLKSGAHSTAETMNDRAFELGVKGSIDPEIKYDRRGKIISRNNPPDPYEPKIIDESVDEFGNPAPWKKPIKPATNPGGKKRK